MSGHQKKSEQLKQQLLDQIKTQQEAVEALSDEELEFVSGGLMTNSIYMNTGVVVPHNNKNYVAPMANANTGVFEPNLYSPKPKA